jgi:hypothetical protein
MATRTAVPCILLIRMRSQVQVLAGPPPITAGQSAVGSEPGAPAASLGRAGAARPSPPARPLAPPGPSTRASGTTTTTHRGRPPSPGTAATRLLRQPRAAACSVPTAQPLATALRTPARPAWSLSGQAGYRRPPTTRPVRHRPPTDQRATSAASPASGPARPSIEPLQDVPAHRDLDPFLWCRLPAAPTWSPTPPPEVGRDGRVGRTGADSSRLDAGRVDTRRPDT